MFKFLFLLLIIVGCNNKNIPVQPPAPNPKTLSILSVDINSIPLTNLIYNINTQPIITINFSTPILQSTISNAIILLNQNGTSINLNSNFVNDSTLSFQPLTTLHNLSKYQINISTALKSKENISLSTSFAQNFVTQLDSSNKFPIITDNTLLDVVQQQTFKYFWDFAHPISGLARERSNEAPETVTSGGSGFGIMCIPIAVNRNFITRTQAVQRMQNIVAFLKNTAQKFHGAFPHWLNGTSGTIIPFSAKDNGADLVETSYLIAGLLTARQFFNGADVAETTLRNDINTIWNNVEWTWFRKNNENVLYWHWSPNFGWDMNMKIQGWNECLITYIMAAASTTYAIPQIVYKEGFAKNGAIQNGNMYYGYTLPLGVANGGPLFFSQYSFLGINPNGLNDVYANYQTQVVNHTKINYEYCKANPKNFYGYSNLCWGLTASDIPNGYNANEPNNDIGVISPTAALSSFPYTPTESMNALKFFYYTLGDKLWSTYGFRDAFSLKDQWFANSYLAIDQGPIMIMIENYRSGLVWNLLSNCPEIKKGMKNVLGFSAPYL